MARIVNQSNGRKYIQFEDMTGKRQSLRLGKVSRSIAEQVKVKVERMMGCKALGMSLDPDLASWVKLLSDEMADRFVAVGLIDSRVVMTLGQFINNFISNRNDKSKSTIGGMKGTKDRLIDFFKADRAIHTITHGECLDFAAWLKKRYKSPASASRMLRRCRQAFTDALRRKLITENPFAGIVIPVPVNSARKAFITREDAAKVLDACPDLRWRLIFALSRFAGLRCPSEHVMLRWIDIDWQRSRMLIRSPKTGDRWCPLFPEIREHLEQAFEAAPEGAVNIFDASITTTSNLRTHFNRILKRAGLKTWPKLFHNLRATCETELAERFPIHVVCAWLGNSSAIANKHYLQVRDENFRAAAGDANSDALLLKKAMQKASGEHGTSLQKQTTNMQNKPENKGDGDNYSVTRTTVQAPPDTPAWE